MLFDPPFLFEHLFYFIISIFFSFLLLVELKKLCDININIVEEYKNVVGQVPSDCSSQTDRTNPVGSSFFLMRG
jgi:hypothetical protein